MPVKRTPPPRQLWRKAMEDAVVVPPLPRCDPAVDFYLANPPFFGSSAFEAKDAVKQLCGAGTSRWDPERKMWGTTNPAALHRLVHSGQWHPAGLQKHHYMQLLLELKARAKHAELVQAAKAAALKAKREREVEEKLKSDRAAERKRRAEEEAERKKEDARAAEVKRIRTQQEARLRANKEAEASTGVPLERTVGLVPTRAEVETCGELGFRKEAIAASATVTWLGLSDGTSLEGRLLRWIGVLEYAVRDANPAIFFDPQALAPLQRERVDQFVSEINAIA